MKNYGLKLSESFGPLHDGLKIIKVIKGQDIDRIILKQTKMKQFPVSDYGKKEVKYIVYTYDKSVKDTLFYCWLNTAKEVKEYIKECQEANK